MTARPMQLVSEARKTFRHGREFTATAGAAAITSITPTSLDARFSAGLHAIFVRLRPNRVVRIARRIEDLLGDGPEADVSPESMQQAISYFQNRIEIRWGEARGAGLRPWAPEVSIEGLEHLARSLERGKGAILWRMSFTSATIVNSALSQRGFDLIHLSSTRHRRSNDSWWMRKVAAPFYTRSEARWLHRRVLRGEGLGYLLELRDELLRNGVVTIVGDLTSARHTETHKIGNTARPIPTGAPSLAHSTGASLHTCVAIRTAPFSYCLTIGPDLEVSGIESKPEARRWATAEFAAEVDRQLRSNTASSMWWGRR